MTKITKWQLALHEFIDARAPMPFCWNSNDCCSFVCAGLTAMTDVDVYADFAGKFTDESGAMSTMLAVTGGTNVEDAAVFITSRFSMVERPSVLFAQRGDVVLFDGELGKALGLVYLDGIHALFIGPRGLNKIKVTECLRAWGVE